MERAFWTEARVAGALLVSILLLMAVAIAIMIVSGAIAGFQPLIRGDIEKAAPYIPIFQFLILLFILSWVVQLLGVALFARLLANGGAEQLAIIAFILILFATIAAAVNFSFRMMVEQWAAVESAQAGSLPALYQPLRDWTSSIFRLGYRLHFIAMIAIGWAMLRTGVLSPAWGWATIGWSGLWLLGGLFGVGAPAVPLLMPAAIGLGLMVSSKSREEQQPRTNSGQPQEVSG